MRAGWTLDDLNAASREDGAIARHQHPVATDEVVFLFVLVVDIDRSLAEIVSVARHHGDQIEIAIRHVHRENPAGFKCRK